jgi:hypothetical protein
MGGGNNRKRRTKKQTEEQLANTQLEQSSNNIPPEKTTVNIMNYLKKYLKYKSKYLFLKNQLGGKLPKKKDLPHELYPWYL